MKPTPEDLLQFARRISEFLTEAGWVRGKQVNDLTFYYPPESLGIQGKYSVALPETTSKAGAENILNSAANSLVEIYGFGNIGDLQNKAVALIDSSKPTRLVTRFIDRATHRGAMPLASLASYASSLEAGLYRGAKFKLGSDSSESKLIAERFAKDCLFLQTEHGSFIAKVEIPFTVLKQGDLFGGEPLVSNEVCSSIFSAIQFLNERILGDETSFDTQDNLEDVIALFDVELLESLTKVLIGSEMDTIDFTLEIGTQMRTSSTGWISEEKKTRLKDFVEFVRDQLLGENDLNVSGKIVELRSRDPEGNKNYIKVVSEYHGDRVFISATLSNEQYQRALDAHRNKRIVNLRGNGIRLKTQIRLTEVIDFNS